MEYPVGVINSIGLQDCSYSEKKHKNQWFFALKNKIVTCREGKGPKAKCLGVEVLE
jgi:hypothetical protein